MSDKEPGPAQRLHTYLEVEQDKFVSEADRRLNALSDHHLAAVVMWLEADTLKMLHELPRLDDPLESAKLRGGIDHGKVLAEELRRLVVERRLRAAQEARETQSNEGDTDGSGRADYEPELPRLIPGGNYEHAE